MTTASQMDFTFTQPEEDRQNTDWPLLVLVDDLNKGQLQRPIFQREFVWPYEKIRGWTESVRSGQAIGVIVTYQLKGGGPKFICDGWQRLTATSLFLDNPQEYGWDFGPNTAEVYCKAYKITVQHRIYRDHQEAMQAFHNLNKGTTLTPAEYYKGYLCLDSTVGQSVYEQVPARVQTYTRPLTTMQKPNRRQDSTLLRDSFALFLQYTMGYTGMTFWDNGSQKVGNSAPIEKLIREKIDRERWTLTHLEKELTNFERFIAEQIAEIEQATADTGQAKKHFSRTTLRWLLHLSIWRKNNKRPVPLYQEFIRAFLSIYKEFKTFTSRPIAIDEKGEKYPVSIQVGRMEAIRRFCKMFNVDLVDGNERSPSIPVRPGYEMSHFLPVSKYGEGETFIEPAMSNRSRGARPVEA